MAQPNQLLTKYLQTNLDFIGNEILPLIEIDYAKSAADTVLGKLKTTIEVLFDENQENQEQLRLIWGHILADAQIAQSLQDALLDAISKVENPEVKQGLQILSEPLVQTIVALNDTDFNNGPQIEKIWLDFLKTEAFITYLERNLNVILSKFISNQSVVTVIVSLLKAFIR